MTKSIDKKSQHLKSSHAPYVVDERPLCQGMRFVLTDAAHPRMVLKNGAHFLVLDSSAQIPACNTLGYGYYRNDTRYLSELEISLDGIQLSLLSSAIEAGYSGNFLYTNPQTENLIQQKITVQRRIVLADILWERITLENFSNAPLVVELKMRFQSDFADIFEVRGLNRPVRGERMIPVKSPDGKILYLAYKGIDGVWLETGIEFLNMTPTQVNEGEVSFSLCLPVREPVSLDFKIDTKVAGQSSLKSENEMSIESALMGADQNFKQWNEKITKIQTDNRIFDILTERSLRDIYILRQPTPKGYGLGAGIPWYCAVFGRDSAITASQLLPFVPDLARECIEVLAAYQGKRIADFQAERPGRILHELRLGELARSHQIPHSPYFGTVDATQLWLLLLCEYVHWTGDLDFARDLWPAVKQAFDWIDSESKGGYLTYHRISAEGLENQGWKDSGDSVMHKDGTLAHPPIAICEAQAYLYASRREVAKIAELIGHKTTAKRLRGQAAELKMMFQKDFWMESEDYLALALDGEGNQVQVISSNPGHCLSMGILDDEKAQAVADRLMSSDLKTGWGIRTLSASSVAFNPISYHNGSVWPHDNAIIADGMRKIGRTADLHKIMQGLFEVAQQEPDFRLPELFCGFDRMESTRPIDYPVSCSPQAWSAGSMFQMIKACVNFQLETFDSKIRIVEPSFPDWLERVVIRNIKIGKASIDLSFRSGNGQTSCQLLRKDGNLKVIVES